MTEPASQLRKQLSAMDYDPGYFCKFVKDQYVRRTIKENGLSNILDIGCDTCYMAGLLNYDKHPFTYLGIDNRESVDIENLNIDKKQGSMVVFDTLGFLQKHRSRYDGILFLDVIEHFDDKKHGVKVFNAACDLLEPGGFIFVSTPNCIDGVLNWPKYHDYEYSLQEILDLQRDDLLLRNIFGWSMSNETYLKENQESPVLPIEISRVLKAVIEPDKARDIMVVFQKCTITNDNS